MYFFTWDSKDFLKKMEVSSQEIFEEFENQKKFFIILQKLFEFSSKGNLELFFSKITEKIENSSLIINRVDKEFENVSSFI